jgi:integrase
VRDVEFLRRRLSVPVAGFVLDELSIQCRDKAPTDLAFAGPNGKYLPRPKASGGWFTGAVKRAGVQNITPHDLRHTCASLSISAGVNVLALQRRLGHTSAKVTPDSYADLFDDLDAVAVSLQSRYSPANALKMCSPGAADAQCHPVERISTCGFPTKRKGGGGGI